MCHTHGSLLSLPSPSVSLSPSLYPLLLLSVCLCVCLCLLGYLVLWLCLLSQLSPNCAAASDAHVASKCFQGPKSQASWVNLGSRCSRVSGACCCLQPGLKTSILRPLRVCLFVIWILIGSTHTCTNTQTHSHIRTLTFSLTLSLSRVVSLRSLRTDLGREFNLPAP